MQYMTKSNKIGIRRRALRLALCAVLVVSQISLPGTALAADAHSHDYNTFTAWTDVAHLPGQAGEYYLETDVSLHES